MSLDKELLEVSFEALANHKKDLDVIKPKLDELHSTIKEVDTKLATEKADIEAKIDTVAKDLPNLVQSEISKIPIPKDGRDGKDGESIVGPAGKDGRDGKSIKGARGERGLPGKDGKTIVGPQGPRGKPGKDGKTIKGQDGVGIKEVRGSASAITIELTNGREKTIKLPKQRQPSVPAKIIGPSSDHTMLKNLVDTDLEDAVNGDILIYQDGIITTSNIAAGSTSPRVEIESMFKEAESSLYKELIYTNGSITNVDIYTNSNKTTKLFSKVITYVNGNISEISILDNVNGGTLTKVLSYSDGNLANIEVSYIA